jgi:hypothetical protein
MASDKAARWVLKQVQHDEHEVSLVRATPV